MPPRTVLAIMAHPDDAELTCAGSVARWVREGWQAVLLIATDGARGAKLPGIDPREMARMRVEEQQRAAAMIGFSQVIHLGFPDGDLLDDVHLRGALVEHVRRIRPERVIAVDPLTVILRDSYVNHRDHRMLGMATLDALYPEASNAGYFPEQVAGGLEPFKVPELYLAGSERPNIWVDVSDTLDLRFRALRCHVSQIRLWPQNGETVVDQQRKLAAVLGTAHGYGYAEEFRRILADALT